MSTGFDFTPIPSPGIDTSSKAFGTSQSASAKSATGATTDKTNDLANQEVFLQLLIAQIKNQNPLSPADSLQYVTQLSQFTGVEQLVDIKNQIKDLSAALKPSANAVEP